MTYLSDLKKLAQAATPGPWYWDGDVCAYDHEQEAPWLMGAKGKKVLYGAIDCDNSWSADLIAAISPERVLAMLDVIEAAKAMRVDIASHENLTLVGSPSHGGYMAPTKWYSAALFDERLAALERS